jgi:pullulanase-type alpha-1,6-glucosidase
VKNIAASGGPTTVLRDLFTDDDWFTDDDSNAHGLVKFAGNHDLGRIGRDIDQANPGASDGERLARAALVQALNFTTRGTPVVYYGDEQGFTGDGGDKDARQNMFPSQVASYNDDDLIGTSATTADDNFDPTHPLYQVISDLAGLRAAHPALSSGAQLHRYSQDSAGVYAFSRIDRDERVEYVVAINNSESPAGATFTVDTPAATFTPLWPAGATPVTSNGAASVTVTVPPLSAVVYRADQPVPTDGEAEGIEIVVPAAGATVTDRTEVRANVSGSAYAEVTFAVKVGDGAYTVLGTDDSAPYVVHHDVTGIPEGTSLTYKAIVADLGGNLNADTASVTVGAAPPPPSPTDRPYAIIHYLRDDGDYGDHTTGDYNDVWGLHLWGDIAETIEWTAPKPFLGEDEYGRFAWVKLNPGATDVGFIVHRGDTKDGTDADRFFNPSETPEIWLRGGDATIYTSQAAAQGFATVHYQRPDGVYDGWGLHLWGDAIADGVGTSWDSPRPFDGVDDFGAYWNVPIKDALQPLNFIIHQGDDKDPGPDQSFVPAEDASVWILSGNETIHAEKGEALGFATLHYHRPAGDYGDYTSTNFNDFWGLHTWGDATDPGWTTPRKPVRFDGFGPVFEVPLIGAKTTLNYIFHRGDDKDPGPDQSVNLREVAFEVWQLQGSDGEWPWLLPVPGGSPASKGNLAEQRAYWVSDDTILWGAAIVPSAQYRLHHAPEGGLSLTDEGVSGDSVVLTPGTADPAIFQKFPHLAGLPALKIGAGDLAMVPELLRGQVAVSASAGGMRLDATGLQIPGVLDDLFAYGGDLGVTFDGATPTVRLWAPTAKDVTLRVFDDATTTSFTEVDMTFEGGVWSATGDASWKDKYYLFAIEVYVPSTGRVETNLVTDPYSLSLSTNSARSQMVDLTDSSLAPAGWASVPKPPLAAPEDIVVYELHVRDFSAHDPSVPDAEQGTFKAFTRTDSYGMEHLAGLAEAGLTHVHLLPAFDIATVNEDRSQWEQPDPAVLATYPPDSEQQQAAVSATADLDGFNWGYDPWHYTTPEGSYSTDPEGSTRIVEFRDMVRSLNETGLRVVMDVVYNHTTAAGQDPKSVLDRVVPGYYHRLDAAGVIATSTCCPNTASEHRMMEKLMVDSIVTWAREYKVDGFRFDLMGHHSKDNMLQVRAALDALTLEHDGVDGSAIYLYGEGWNFGEVANDARFVQATQQNMAGTGIGTFNDRLRDAVRGGGPFDGGESLVRNQGMINGLFYDPNSMNSGAESERQRLLLSSDQVRVGLAGNLAEYTFVDRAGNVVTGSQIDYNGSPAGYNLDPQEHIVYVEAHDNQTLFDISQYKHPVDTTMSDRVRAQNLGTDFVLLSQGVPFIHAGQELLRSKSMDRDSYNSGDWFNRLDFTYEHNNWGVGLPVAEKNQENWPLIGPLLADPLLAPGQEHIEATAEHAREMLTIRSSSPLFRLQDAEQVAERLQFHNTGPDQLPGLIVMTLLDPADGSLAGGDLDVDVDGLVVLFNVTDDDVTFTLPAAAGGDHALHPVLAASSDAVVRGSGFDTASGTFSVPARTTAVFVDPVDDTTPPVVIAELVPDRVTPKSGTFRVVAECVDDRPGETITSILLNGQPVVDGELVHLHVDKRSRALRIPGLWRLHLWAPTFTLTVSCTDAAGNTTTSTAHAEFGR